MKRKCFTRLLQSLPLLMLLLTASLFLTAPPAHAVSRAAMIKDINGTPANSTYFPRFPAVINGVGYFAAEDVVYGWELWRSDGTEAGTYMVKDIVPGAASSNPGSMVVANGKLFFSAYDAVHGQEPWVSDGTEAGTMLLKDLVPGPTSSVPLDAALAIGDTLYFFTQLPPSSAPPMLWKTDGTEAGTVLVKDLTQEARYVPYLSMANINGNLLFSALPFTGSNFELWKSDGTGAGTIKVTQQFNVIKNMFGPFYTICNGLLFYEDADYLGGVPKLWKSDGTTAGTVAVADLTFSPYSGTCLNNTFYFAANDPATGWELWQSDGSAAGTSLVKDINPGGSSSSPASLIVANGAMYFTAITPETGRKLWKSDGTAAGTVPIKDIAPNFIDFAEAGGKLVFPFGNELWLTDGTEAGTMFIQQFSASISPYGPVYFANLGNRLLFGGADDTHGLEPWSLSLAPAPFSSITTPTLNAKLPSTYVAISGIAQSDTGSAVQKVEVSTDGGATWSEATGTDSWSYTWIAPAVGSYTIKARATDGLGAVESPAGEIQVTIDTTPPTCAIISPTANAQLTDGSVIIIGTAADNAGLQRVEVSMDNGASWNTTPTDPSGHWSYVASLTAGASYTILARAVDLAGNSSNASVSITVGTIPSGTVIINDNAVSTDTGLVTLTIDATDGLQTCGGAYPRICGTVSMQLSRDEYGFNWGPWQEAATSVPWVLQGDKVCSRFRNAAGQVSATVCDTIQVIKNSVLLTSNIGVQDSYFGSIGNALNSAFAGQYIYIREGNFLENVTIIRSVTLFGSRDNSFVYLGGTSTLSGGLTVASNAQVKVEKLQVVGSVTVSGGTLSLSDVTIL